MYRIHPYPHSFSFPLYRPDDDEECSICLDHPTRAEWVRLPQCTHSFHRVCIQQWLTHAPTCPICIRPLPSPEAPAGVEVVDRVDSFEVSIPASFELSVSSSSSSPSPSPSSSSVQIQIHLSDTRAHICNFLCACLCLLLFVIVLSIWMQR